MRDFVKRMNANGVYLNFYFNHIYTANEDRYHVSVVGKDNKTYAFNLEERKKEWIIENPEGCPLWLLSIEKDLSQAIKDQLSV